MKFSHVIVMLALLSSSLFGADKKFSVVEAALTSDSSADHEEQAGVPTDTKIDDSSPPPSAPDEAPTPLSAPSPTPTQSDSFVQPTQQEKTILSTILKSFKNGHVDLATLSTALNDPNISKLASTLSKAKLTKLAEVLEEPQVDLRKLVAALSDPDLNLDKLVATFGDSNVLPPTNLKAVHGDSGIMAMMKNWAGSIGDSLKGHMTLTSPSGANDKSTGEKHGVDFDKTPVEATTNKPGVEGGSDIPAGFERSTPSPDANTYGKSLLTGMDVKNGTADNVALIEVEGEQAQPTFNHKLIYYAVAGLLAVSMLIFLATRLSKSSRGEEIEETRSSVRLVV